MKCIEIYEAYKKKYENVLVLVKDGIFYSTFKDDANIIWHRFGYKHLKDKISFGEIAYDKVVDDLKSNEISFCIVDKEKEYFKYIGDSDVYNNYLNIANKAYDKKKKEDMLVEKVRSVFKNDSSKYNDIMAYLEGLLNS